MGWARKLPSGRFQGQYRDGNGKLKNAGTFDRKAEATRAANAVEAEARSLGWRDPAAARETWGQWYKEWWGSKSAEPSTTGAELSLVRTHLLPKWQDVPLIEITRHEGRAWLRELAETEGRISKAEEARRKNPEYKPQRNYLAASSISRIFGLFSNSINAAVDAEILDVNPLWKLKMPSRPPATERFLTRHEVDLIERELPTLLDRPFSVCSSALVLAGVRGWGCMLGVWMLADRCCTWSKPMRPKMPAQ